MRITGWDPILAGALTANDVLLIESLGTGLTKKLSLTELATYLFGGTLSTGIFVTLDGVQTLTMKRLTSPKINSASATSVTSAELDILHGATLTTAELNLLHGLVAIADLSSIQTMSNKTMSTVKLNGWYINNGTSWVEATVLAEELNYLDGLNENLRAWMTDVEDDLQTLLADFAAYVTRECSTGWTQVGTDVKVVTAANVLSLLGISSGYVINAFPCIKVWENPYSNVYSECAATQQITTIYTGGRTNFSELEVDNLTDGKSYVIAMRVELVKVP